MPGIIGSNTIQGGTDVVGTNWDTEVHLGTGVYTASAGESISDINVYNAGTGSGTAVIAVYEVTGGNTPTNLIHTQSVTMTASVGWKTVSGLNISLTNGTSYALGIQYCGGSAGAGWSLAFGTSQPSSIGSQCQTPPATWTQNSTGTGPVSMYATVVAGGTTGTVAETLDPFTSSASGTFTDWTTFSDGVSATPGATVTGLTNDVTYEFRVAAVNAIGTGPTSNVVEETPTGGAAPITGTVAETLDPFTSTASGTVAPPEVSGSLAETLDPFTSTASGTVVNVYTGTVAETLDAFTSQAEGSLFAGRAARSISGRKVLDQNGDVFVMLTASAWSLADLSDANITTVLEGLQDAGFTGVTCWSGGGYHINATWEPEYERKSDSSDWWTGTPWASSFGAAWNAMDHIADECTRLGMILNFSFCGGFDVTGAGPDWEAVTNTNMRDVGVAVATRYPIETYPTIVWHFMLDDANAPASTRGQRISALFDGINDTEGGTTRPVRWMEPANGASADSQGWMNLTDTKVSVNVWYEYSDSHVVEIETVYAEDTVPVGDCEPPYDGSPNAGGSHAGLRIRVASTFIEGGWFINWGHEDLWPFGKTGLFTESLTYTQVLTHSGTLDAGRIYSMLRPYVEDTTWAPVSTFVTTGEGTGTSKAAQGASDTAAIACFPNSRTIQINTTILAGTDPVQIRWYDPTDGTYDVVTSSEAQQSGRSVTHPGNNSNSAGTSEWILVVEPTNDRSGSVAETLDPFTSTATGVVEITGSVAETLDPFTSTASGQQGEVGTVAETLDPFTSTASGTTQQYIGSAAETLDPFTSSASGTFTPPPISGSVAETLDPFTSTASGTTQQYIGSVAETLDPFTSNGLGAFIPAGSGSAAITLAPFTSTASGTFTPQPITGTVAETLGPFVSTASGSNGATGGDLNITFVALSPTLVERTADLVIYRSVGSPTIRPRSTTIAMRTRTPGAPTGVVRTALSPSLRPRTTTVTLRSRTPGAPTLE